MALTKCSQNRKYEEIKKKEMVRIMIKHKFGKAHMPSWPSETHKVIIIDNDNVMLDHPTKRKVFLRHEIRK